MDVREIFAVVGACHFMTRNSLVGDSVHFTLSAPGVESTDFVAAPVIDSDQVALVSVHGASLHSGDGYSSFALVLDIFGG